MSALGDRGRVKDDQQSQDKQEWKLLYSEMGGLSGVVRTQLEFLARGRGRGGGVTSPQQEQLCDIPQEAKSCPHPQLGQRFPSLTQGKQSHHLLSRD